jgi:hypothetical protein
MTGLEQGIPEMDAARCERKEAERFLRLSIVEQEGGERRAGLGGDDQSKEVSLRFGAVCGPVDEGWVKIPRGDNSRWVVPEGRSMLGGRESRRNGSLPLWPDDLAVRGQKLEAVFIEGGHTERHGTFGKA